MIWNSVILPLAGGALIGIAVTILLAFNGRVTGISGIISASLSVPTSEGAWRWLFLGGLLSGGALVQFLKPELLMNFTDRGIGSVFFAGLLVGYGTLLGNGCTSGHGVCGISRFSIRSLIATITFMLFGFLSVQAVRFMNGAPL